jgi:hypothetical protein
VNLTEIKTNLLAAIERLGKLLPANTLDSLINLLGGPQYVAEMTGRKGRVVAREGTGEVEYELRTADSDVSLELMNMAEKGEGYFAIGANQQQTFPLIVSRQVYARREAGGHHLRGS